jgi:hypothetical protein
VSGWLVEFCCRNHHGEWDTPAVPGFGFCKACLAWLLEETDDDPLKVAA